MKIFIFNALYNYKLMQDLEHENYMLKSILKTSPSSESFSFDEYRKVSPAYYNDLTLQLIEKYQDISEIKRRQLNADENSTKLTCVITVMDKKPIKALYKSFQSLSGIDSISIQEFCEG